MSQNSSLPQVTQFVSEALMPDTPDEAYFNQSPSMVMAA